MEFVAGVPMVRYCDECRLTTRERLELFVQVCHAVQHAHQKGIIHRDLKPSNILVTHFDGKPVPKVIDFGIAKAANQALTGMTLYTRTGSLIGTPEYMSPEQALTSGLDVDTRTDIYSLGVILYELLTGTLPLDPASLHEASIERMAQIIKTIEPPKPSTRLSMLDGTPLAAVSDTARLPGVDGYTAASSMAEVASLRRCDPRSLQRELRGDLDWIVLRAMEKDRTRRYETANALAMDVRRHLDNEPIVARPPTPLYRMSKFVRKHRVGVTAAAAVVLAMGAGLALATYGLMRARDERDLARISQQNEAEHRRIAEAATAEANETSRLMGGLFTEDAPNQFQLGIRRLESGWLAEKPDPQAALRIMLGAVGVRNSGRVSLAETRRVLTGAMNLVPRLDEPRRSEVAGAAHFLLGAVADLENNASAAEQEFRDSRSAYRTFKHPAYYSYQALAQLAAIRKSRGDVTESRALVFEAIQEGIRYDQPFVDTSPYGQTHLRYGIALARVGQFLAAIAQWDKAAELAPKDSQIWYFRGCTLAYLHEDERYGENCRVMAEQFGNEPKFTTIDHTVKTCLLRPDSGVERTKLREMVGRELLAANASQVAWANLAKGMERYRAGDFDACLQSMERCRQTGSDNYPMRNLTCDLFTAMAFQKLGKLELAHSTFDAVDRALREDLPQAGTADIAKDGAINTEDWLIARTIQSEAERLLNGAGSASRPAR
jgi:tetratricopeptide (TPR) repeat protein